MECTVDWVAASGMAFSAETGSGHLLTMDGAPDGGGRNLAPRPMETVLAGTGACTAYDVVLILQARPPRRARLPGQGELRARADGSEGVHQDPHALRRQRRRRWPRRRSNARSRLSHEKYCSATIMLAKTAAITTSLRAAVAPRTCRGSDVVSRRRHHPGGSAHRPAHRAGQAASAPACSARDRMAGLVFLHLLRRWRVTRVAGRQAVEVAVEVLLDLALGLDHEAQADARRRRGRRARPMPNAPAYQSGFSRLGRAPSSCSRSAVQARWSVSSRAACSNWRRKRGSRRARAPARCTAPGRTPRRRG